MSIKFAILSFLVALAHPHFHKTIMAKLPGGAEATIAYNTTPANLGRAESAAVGTFVTPRRPKLSLSADVVAGGVTIPAGTYTIGVIKKGANDWTMGLYKDALARGAEPDLSQVINLDSSYASNEGSAEHMLIDVTPGSGKFEGKAVLTLHFGRMFLEGVISDGVKESTEDGEPVAGLSPPQPISTSKMQESPFLRNAEVIKRGEQVYRARCVGCHLAGGGTGPNLFGTTQDPSQFFEAVAAGTDEGTTMPAFDSLLTPEQIWEVYAFVVSRDGLE